MSIIDDFLKAKSHLYNKDRKIFYGNIFLERTEISTLHGSPIEVKGSVNFSNTFLTNLKFGPKIVANDYLVGYQLTSLEGCPIEVDREFNFSHNSDLQIIDYLPNKCKSLVFNGCPITDISKIIEVDTLVCIGVTYQDNLAILPSIKCRVILYGNVPPLLKEIIRVHESDFTKENIFNCQYELLEKGFELNARWQP